MEVSYEPDFTSPSKLNSSRSTQQINLTPKHQNEPTHEFKNQSTG